MHLCREISLPMEYSKETKQYCRDFSFMEDHEQSQSIKKVNRQIQFLYLKHRYPLTHVLVNKSVDKYSSLK